MAKGKKSVSHAGPHKSHGPKKHLHAYTGPMKWQFGKMGVLKKNWDYESWLLACQARGKRTASYNEFKEFFKLPEAQKKDYFQNLSKNK